MEFRGYQSTYVASLPPVDDTPLFQRYDSLYRVLAKATATNPDDRFQSADELRDQLLGVLREVVAVDSGGRGRRALDRVVAVRLADRHRRRARVDRPARAAGRPLRPMADVAGGRVARRRRAAPRGARAGAGADGRGAAGEGAAPRSTPASFTVADAGRRTTAHRQPVGVAGGVAVGSRGARAVRPTRPRPRSTPCSARCRASSRRSSRSRSRCEQPGRPDLAEQLYAVCAATDANYVAARRVRSWPARGQSAVTSTARRAARPRRADERRVRRGAAPACGVVRPRPARGLTDPGRRGRSIENIAIDPRVLVNSRSSRSSPRPWTEVEQNGDQPTAEHRPGEPAAEASCAAPPSTRTAISRR